MTFSLKRALRPLGVATLVGGATLSLAMSYSRSAEAQSNQKREDIALAIGETKTIPVMGID